MPTSKQISEPVVESALLSENFSKTILEKAFEGFGILNAKLENIYQSPGVERMFGFPAVERIGKSAMEHIHPSDIQNIKKNFSELLKQPGISKRSELRLKHKDGYWVYVEAAATNLLHDPNIKGIVVNYHDISDKKRMEQEVRESEDRYKRMVENAPEAITLLDIESGKFVDFNKKTLDLFGLSE